MAKKNNKSVKTAPAVDTEVEKSDEVLTEVKPEDKKSNVSGKNQKKKAKDVKKKAKNDKPKRNLFKEIFSELKKVNWPTFKQALSRTGTVIAVVALFMVLILGIDALLGWLVSLIIV